MHDLLKASSFALLGLLALSVPQASAQSAPKAPSFDCKKASSPDEKAICENYSVAWLDRQLARAWKEAKQRVGNQGLGALRASQSSWLSSRRGCGSDGACLGDRYMAQLKKLTAVGSERPSISGAFAYTAGETSSGALNLVHHEDDTLAGTIETVSGASFHLCSIQFEGAEKIGNHYLWTAQSDVTDGAGRQCQVLIQPLPGGDVRVDSLHCGGFCGARGFFDAMYRDN